MRVLHIDCSVRNEWSVSRELSGLFVTSLKEKIENADVDYLDIAKNPPSHPTALMARANYTAPDERTPEMLVEIMESDTLVDRMIAADTYVIGMPMYNFTVPSNFKAFVDNIVRIGRTFKLSEHGSEGVLTDKKVYLINTRGADFSPDFMTPMDQLVPYVKVVFGFLGITDITFINVYPVEFAAKEARAIAIANAKAEIAAIVESL